MLKRLLFPAMASTLKRRSPLERFRADYGMDVVNLPPNVTVGRHTYGIRETTFILPTPQAPISIGSFCSIGAEVRILGHADHATTRPSTYPFRTLLFRPFERPADPAQLNFDAVTRGPVSVGNDVWIGLRAIILSGVTIGSGAIIGAGAVVARDVPPYAIAVGNPARVVRRRFPEETVKCCSSSRGGTCRTSN